MVEIKPKVGHKIIQNNTEQVLQVQHI